MKYGLFMMPSHPPERNIYDAHQWDLDYLALFDSLGYDEAWIGEHFTSPWEPIPAPDIMIAQALLRTSRMKLGSTRGRPIPSMSDGSSHASLVSPETKKSANTLLSGSTTHSCVVTRR